MFDLGSVENARIAGSTIQTVFIKGVKYEGYDITVENFEIYVDGVFKGSSKGGSDDK